jgi:hypothetical protein
MAKGNGKGKWQREMAKAAATYPDGFDLAEIWGSNRRGGTGA